MMHILHIASEYPPQKVYGLGRYVCDLSEELVAEGHSVHVMTNSISGRDQDVVINGVHVHRVDFPPPPKPPGSVAPVMAFNFQLQRLATRLGVEGMGRPEVVVSHDWLTALAGHRIARRLGLPHVWTVHDLVHGKSAGRVEKPEDKSVFAMETWAAREADLTIVNSGAIGKELEERYDVGARNFRLLPCGINPKRFQSTQSPARLRAFREVLTEPDAFLVTYAGRLDVEKGIDTLVNAFGRVHSEAPHARLVIAGSGVLEETIKRHIETLGLPKAIRLIGYLRGEALRGFYAVSDLHVCPSHYEPFGLVAIEAMCAGAPVVVSDTGGLSEIVTGEALGRRVPPRDDRALAEAIVTIARDPSLRRSLAEGGRKHACARYAWPVIAPQAVRLYSEACDGKPLSTGGTP